MIEFLKSLLIPLQNGMHLGQMPPDAIFSWIVYCRRVYSMWTILEKMTLKGITPEIVAALKRIG